MKTADFKQVISATPRVVPVFRVKKVPNWAAGSIAVGDEVFYCGRADSIRTLQIGQGRLQRLNLDLTASYLEFIDYQSIQ